MGRITDAERARRLARVMFSDIALYAGDQLRIGIEKDDLFDRLGLELRSARVFWEHQVDPALPERERIFNHALVDVLIYGQRRIQSHIW